MKRIYSNGKKDSDVVCVPLDQMLQESKRAYLAAPYFTWAEPILDVASKGKDIRLLIEINGITDLEELSKILKTDEEIEIRYFNRGFHAKIYIFDDTVLLGSANLTCQGLTKNREAAIKLCQNESPDAFQEIFDLFAELWGAAGKLTKEKLILIEKEHKELSRQTQKSRTARKNFESKFDPIDAVEQTSERKRFKRRKYNPDKSTKSKGIDEMELNNACEMVFGTSDNMVSGINRPNPPPVQTIDGLDVHFGRFFHRSNPYKVFFLPESWVNPLGKTWANCHWLSGFFSQPLMADFCFNVEKDKMTLFGQLKTTPGDGRNKLITCINDAAKRISPPDRIQFNEKRFDPTNPQSAFFIGNEYKLYEKYDADSLARVMREALKDYTPSIEAIGESLAKSNSLP